MICVIPVNKRAETIWTGIKIKSQYIVVKSYSPWYTSLNKYGKKINDIIADTHNITIGEIQISFGRKK